jgi:tyrosyl-tRNA synthetase
MSTDRKGGQIVKRFDQQFCARMSESYGIVEADELVGFLLPKCQDIVTPERLYRKIVEQSTLNVKFEINPTMSEIHIGHIVPIMLLRQFAKAGHHIDFVICDFTVQTNDNAVPDQILKNMQIYTSQIEKYIDLSLFHIHYNTEWLNRMTLQEFFTIFQQVNLSEVMHREDFKVKIRNEQVVSISEICYSVLMGIDSVHLGTHIEVGDIDQLLDYQQRWKVMRQLDMDEEVILITNILEGTNGSGKKMSQNHGNYIAVNATREDKFGKIMSIPDRLIGKYFRCFADVHERELVELDTFIASNPLEAKKQLATLMVSIETKCITDGLLERESFERKFSQRKIRDEDCTKLIEYTDNTILNSLMKSGQFKSKCELHRLFAQQSVRSVNDDGDTIISPEIMISQIHGIIRVGKHRFFLANISEGDRR